MVHRTNESSTETKGWRILYFMFDGYDGKFRQDLDGGGIDNKNKEDYGPYWIIYFQWVVQRISIPIFLTILLIRICHLTSVSCKVAPIKPITFCIKEPQM